MNLDDWAEDTARTILQVPLPRRWAHTQGVAAQARSLAVILGDEADLVAAAAWLHDVGYGPDVHDTGFHPLDGARYLRDRLGAEDMVCRLVAHHSLAIIEAEERGMADELAREFAPAPSHLADALIYCDMVTGPDGQHVPVDQRLADIHARYGPDDLVSRAITRSGPLLTAAVGRVSQHLIEAAEDDGLRQAA
jgi:hypothetical protein